MTASTYEKALKLLARRAHSRRQLEKKLLRSSDQSVVEEVLERLTAAGYLDDSQYAFSRADYLRRHKKWGNLRIRLDLKKNGVSATIIDYALSQLEEEQPELATLRRVILSGIERFGTPVRVSDLKKIFDRCVRLGYSPAMVRSELEIYFSSVNWEE
ncbi:MAG TPA: regulatory protein RecX [Acidobacteriota bacterium]|nr:regulatory protein RecX [Acidobacteriota bacterium]